MRLETALGTNFCPRRFISKLVVVIAALGLLSDTPRAQLGPYSFRVLADTAAGSPFQDFGVPTINSQGEVVFAARLRSGGSGIYRWGGVPQRLESIFEDPSRDFLDMPSNYVTPAVDPSGRVLFQLDDAVMVGVPGAVPSVVADASSSIPLVSTQFVQANTCGRARLISRSTDSGGRAVVQCLSTGGFFLGGGSLLERVCDFTSGLFQICFDPYGLPARVEVSPNGFVGGIGYKVSPIFGGLVPVIARHGASGMSVLFDPEVNAGAALSAPADLVGINDFGTIAYSAYDQIAGGRAIYTIDTPGQPRALTDPRGAYRSPLWPSINRVGEVAFVDEFRRGLFTGPDPVFDKVMAQGDTLPGYPNMRVDFVSFQHPGINTNGQLVFIAHLSDLTYPGVGGLVVVRADPPGNDPPVVTNPGGQQAPEGSPWSLQMQAFDPNDDVPLTYSLSVTPPPPPLVAPALTLAIDRASGLITGTPGPGTKDFVYTLRVTVEDSRVATASESFSLTITAPVPAPRLNLTATANLAAQGIDLTWQNPVPDIAAAISLSISEDGGPFSEFQLLSPNGVAFRFLNRFASNRVLCFKANGRSADGFGWSADSNIACARYPEFVIWNIQVPIATITENSATITWQTTMPANMSVVLGPAGPITSVPPDVALPTSFSMTVSGLSAATPYTVQLEALSIPVGMVALADVSFTTSAASGGGNGNGEGNGTAPILTIDRIDRQFVFVPRLVGEDGDYMGITVGLSNARQAPVGALNVRVSLASSVVWRCARFDACATMSSSLSDTNPAVAIPLAAGESREVRLRFPVDEDEVEEVAGNQARLYVVVTFDYAEGGALVSSTALRDFPVFLPP